MIDKLDLMIDANARIHANMASGIPWVPAAPRLRYSQTAYVEIHGIHLQLYREGRPSRGSLPDNKIEIHDVYELSADQIINAIESIFDVHASKLRLSRVDFVADVRGYSVEWFYTSCVVKGAQVFKMVDSKGGSARSLYHGQRPNQICIYNKRLEQGKKAGPVFFDTGDTTAEPDVLTRVERRANGRSLIGTFKNLGDLLKGAHLFDPFTGVELKPLGSAIPMPESCNCQFLKAYALRRMIMDDGRQTTRTRVNKGTGNKFAKYEKEIDLLRPSSDIRPDLAAIYQQSVREQLYPTTLAKTG
jgi:hypothetical protein